MHCLPWALLGPKHQSCGNSCMMRQVCDQHTRDQGWLHLRKLTGSCPADAHPVTTSPGLWLHWELLLLHGPHLAWALLFFPLNTRNSCLSGPGLLYNGVTPS